MEINQTNSTNYETRNINQPARSAGVEGADQAEKTNTQQTKPDGAKITTNGIDRVEISREAQELAQKNNSTQEGQVAIEGGSAQAQIAAESDISNVM